MQKLLYGNCLTTCWVVQTQNKLYCEICCMGAVAFKSVHASSNNVLFLCFLVQQWIKIYDAWWDHGDKESLISCMIFFAYNFLIKFDVAFSWWNIVHTKKFNICVHFCDSKIVIKDCIFVVIFVWGDLHILLIRSV
jgi:hypothetical protein